MKDRDKASRGKSSACFELSVGYENTAITKGGEGEREREKKSKSNFLHLLCPRKKVKHEYLCHVTEGGEVVWGLSGHFDRVCIVQRSGSALIRQKNEKRPATFQRPFQNNFLIKWDELKENFEIDALVMTAIFHFLVVLPWLCNSLVFFFFFIWVHVFFY